MEKALDAAARPFDCIVMDILMQRMGGIEACQLLREKRNVRMPIIAATVDVGAKAEAMYYGAGFDVVLGKPYTKELMRTKLLEAQRRRGGGGYLMKRQNAKALHTVGKTLAPSRGQGGASGAASSGPGGAAGASHMGTAAGGGPWAGRRPSDVKVQARSPSNTEEAAGGLGAGVADGSGVEVAQATADDEPGANATPPGAVHG